MSNHFGPVVNYIEVAKQQNFLEKLFMVTLMPVLAYRLAAEKEMFPSTIGTSITKTRLGLIVPNYTPLDPSTNTNIDNGMTPSTYGAEQYTLTLEQVAQTVENLNILDNLTTIDSFVPQHISRLAIATGAQIDNSARAKLFNAYMGGNTYSTATAVALATTVVIDDIRGFQYAFDAVSGQLQPVSPSNLLSVNVNGIDYLCGGAVADVSNVSAAISIGGISGYIVLSTALGVDIAVGVPVISNAGSQIIRPAGKLTTAALTSSDTLKMADVLAAVTYLRNNAIPADMDGYYTMVASATSINQLYADPEFALLNRGRGIKDPTYKEAYFDQTLGVRIISTTQAPIQPAHSGPVDIPVNVQRPIVFGRGALAESVFKNGIDAIRASAEKGTISNASQVFTPENQFHLNPFGTDEALLEGCYMNIRGPIDRLGQIMSFSSSYVGGFVAPTDALINSTVIATASNANFKRAVIIETA